MSNEATTTTRNHIDDRYNTQLGVRKVIAAQYVSI